MEAIQLWHTRPVFISSTFKDMHAERDYLRSHVFAELAESLRERHCHLEPIDLRLGVETVELASEEAKELEVLKVCLNEIERSRPFLLVFLGDRYGWVPPESRMKSAAQEAGFATELTGKSVTALEIEFGILLKDPEQRRRCLFFFRDPLPYDQMPPEVAARYSDQYATDEGTRAGHAKLVALKAAIETNPDFHGRVHHYRAGWDQENHRVTGLDGFGKLVARTLWNELDAETKAHAQTGERTWEDLERDALAEFVEHRSRDFIGRDDITRDLLALSRSPAADSLDPMESKPEQIRLPFVDPLAALSLTVYCDSAGVVESTPKPLVEPRYPGPISQASKYSSSANSVAWGVCITGDPGSGKSALFSHLYCRIDSEPDILLLAHAAGISPRATSVDTMLRRWIGEMAKFLQITHPLPENASADDVDTTFASLLARASTRTRVVVLLDALNQFEPTTRARFLTWLPKLWPANARLIATALPGEVVEVLHQRPGVLDITLSPLSEQEAESIAKAVSARHHRRMNPEVLHAVTAKRLPDGTLAAGNPLWLTLAVEQLNLLDEDDFARAEREYVGTPEQRLHEMVLDVAGRMPPEVAGLYGWLLEQTEKVHGVAAARAFAAAIALSRFGWRESDLRALVPAMARVLAPAHPVKDWNDLKLAALRRAFRAHVMKRGPAEQWDFFHLQMRDAVRQRILTDDNGVRRAHATIADHLETLPRNDTLRSTELMVHLIGADDRSRAAQDYGEASDDDDYLDKAGATRALANHIFVGADQDPNPGLAWVVSLLDHVGDDPDRAGLLCDRFNFDLRGAIENDANLATRHVLLGAAEQTLTHLVNQDPSNVAWQHDLAVSHCRVGDVLVAKGDAAGALRAYRESLAIIQRLAAADPSLAEWQHNLSASHDSVGGALLAQGDAAGAMRAYRESLAIRQRLATADPTNAVWQHDLSVSHINLGYALFKQGDAAGALRTYGDSLAITQRLAAADPGNAAWQRALSISHINVGEALLAQGDEAGAVRAYRESLAIVQRLAAADPSNAIWQRDLFVSHEKVGDTLLAQGDAAGALRAYRDSQAICQRLAAVDPSNAARQRDLSVSHNKVGDALLAQGEAAGALRDYHDGLAIAQRLAAADLANAVSQRDLWVSHWKLADLHKLTGNTEAEIWWRRMYETLLGMKRSQMHLSPQDEQIFNWLAAKVGR
jgi:tetratricopeptide (TPR) repeat protein